MKKISLALFLILPALALAEPAEDLLAAVKRNDLKAAKTALAKGASPNAIIDAALKRTVFHIACARGNPEMVKLLLANKADPRKADAKGEQSFHFAASGNYDKVLDLLLKGGADKAAFRAWVNKPEYEGFTQLHIAARDGRAAMAGIYLPYAAGVDARTDKGWTALALACSNLRNEGKDKGYTAIVKLLLGKKADPFIPGPEGSTAFDYALIHGRSDIAKLMPLSRVPASSAILAYLSGDKALYQKLLSSLADINGTDAEGQTLLVHAILKADQATVKDLLKRGADSRLGDKYRRPPIQRAAEVGNIAILGLLLDAGIDPDAPGSRGPADSPLCAALAAKKNDAAAWLIGKGAEPNPQGRYLPLVAAIQGDNLEGLKLLVSKGADVNNPGEGLDALHMAVRLQDDPTGSRSGMIEYLLSSGAQVNRPMGSVGTPLDQAIAQRREKAQAILKAAGAKTSAELAAGGASAAATGSTGPSSPAAPPASGDANPGAALFAAMDAKDLAAVIAALDALPSIDADLAGGRTALFFLTRSGMAEAAAHALSKGASLSYRDNDGATLLMTACESRSLETVDLILSKGKWNLNSGDGAGKTPLMYAVTSAAISARLLGSGARADAADAYGQTALYYATGYHEPEALAVASLLLDAGANPNAAPPGGSSPIARARRMGYQEMVDLLLSRGAVDLSPQAEEDDPRARER